MAERASLKRQIKLVNRVAALSAFFLLTSCGGNDNKVTTPVLSEISAPIVWQTPFFESELSGFSVSEGSTVLLLVALDGKGIDLITVDGTPIAETGPHIATALSNSAEAKFDGADLRIFPGIDKLSGEMTVYVYGDGLKAPIELSLDPSVGTKVDGICASSSNTDGAIAKIAYWTFLENDILVVGELRSSDNGQLGFFETDRIPQHKYLTTCAMDGDLITTGGGFGLQFQKGNEEPVQIDIPDVPVSLSALSDISGGVAAMSFSNGSVMLVNTKGKANTLSFQEGLRVSPPEHSGEVVLSRSGRVGSLPNGFLAVESKTAEGTQIIFVDLKTIADQL